MKDPTDSIITTFYRNLNGQLKYNNKNWPFKTFGELTDDYDNVNLIDVTFEDISDEDDFIHECTVLIEVKEGSVNMASWKGTNAIGNQIVERIAYKELSFEDFDLVGEIMVSGNLLKDYSDINIITRKLLRFRFKLQENGDNS